MITRTSYTTTVKVTTVDIVNRAFNDEVKKVLANLNTEDAIAAYKKSLEKDGIIVADIEVIEIKSELRGMSDEKWLAESEVIEPKTEFSKRGRKPKIN